MSQGAETDVEKILSLDQINGSTRKKNTNLKKSDYGGQKVVLNTMATKRTSQLCCSPTIEDSTFFQKFVPKDKDGFSSCKEYIDLECSPQKESR